MNKDYEVLNELVPKTQELHRAIFDKGYEQGLEDAWTASLIITDMDENDIAEVFGIDYTYTSILRDYTASEAIRNIKEWGEKKKKSEIMVGDEVNAPGFHVPVVVVALYDSTASVKVMSSFGDTGIYPKINVTKTGRTFPQISEVLEQLKG